MAAPNTSGYQVSVLPQLPQIDPRLFNVGTPAAQAFTQGLGNAQQFQQIADASQAMPLRRQLAQIQLEESQARRALLPLQIAASRAKLLQPIETVVDTGIAEVPRYPAQTVVTETGKTVTEHPAGNDVFATETVDVIDPQTGFTKRITRNRTPLSTIEQQAAAAAQADYREAGLDIKQQAEDTRLFKEQSRATLNTALAEAAQEKINNPGWQVVGRGTDGNGKLVYTQVKKDGSGQTRTIPTDLLPVQQVSALDALLVGMGVGRPAGPVTAVAPAAVPGVDADILALSESLGGRPRTSVAVVAPITYPTVEAANAAISQGRHKVGDRITVGTQTFTVQQ